MTHIHSCHNLDNIAWQLFSVFSVQTLTICPQVVLGFCIKCPTCSLPSLPSPHLCAFFKTVFISTVGAQKIKLYFLSAKEVSVSILAFLWEMRVPTDKCRSGLSTHFDPHKMKRSQIRSPQASRVYPQWTPSRYPVNPGSALLNSSSC